jgi:hypothetical protein
MRRIIVRSALCGLVSFAASLIACTHDTAFLKVEKSLPPEKLARYNDSFDSFREDIWEKAAHVIANIPLMTNFKQAAISIENGRLKMETQTGSFSTGAIESKFYLKGDFDIQVDCDIGFLKDIGDMDQIISFIAFDTPVEIEAEGTELVFLQVKKWPKKPVLLEGGYRQKGKPNWCHSRQIDNRYQGSLRILRIGDRVTLLYTTEVNGKWHKACSISRPTKDVRIRMVAQNHFIQRKAPIDAQSPFTVFLDNFKINAAQEIIEYEI